MTDTIFSQRPQTREDFEAARQTAPKIRTNADHGTVGSVTVQNGQMVTDTRVQGVATALTPDYDDRVVEVNGATMSRTQYNRLVTEGAIPPGAKVVDRFPHLSTPVAPRHPFVDGSAGQDNNSGNTEDNAKATEDDGLGDDAVGSTLRAGQKALDAARQALGADADTVLNDKAISGDLTPPEGMSTGSVQTIVAAYTAMADETMQSTGIDSATLSAVLSDAELADARLAVLRGDAAGLTTLAGKVADTLASLPAKDPSAFTAFMESRFGDDIDYKVEKGRGFVMIEGQGYVPFDTIVRMGWLTKAKRGTAPGGDE